MWWIKLAAWLLVFQCRSFIISHDVIHTQLLSVSINDVLPALMCAALIAILLQLIIFYIWNHFTIFVCYCFFSLHGVCKADCVNLVLIF